jgi:hypothetical protein
MRAILGDSIGNPELMKQRVMFWFFGGSKLVHLLYLYWLVEFHVLDWHTDPRKGTQERQRGVQQT